MLLDWEYAHAADPFWDLAGWSANNDFGDPTAARSAGELHRPAADPREYSRLRRLGWLYDYVCLLWSELYLNPQRDAGPSEPRRQWRPERGCSRRASKQIQVVAPNNFRHTSRLSDDPLEGKLNGDLNGADDRSGPGRERA